MTDPGPRMIRRLIGVSLALALLLAVAVYLGLAAGSTGLRLGEVFRSLVGGGDRGLSADIIWRLCFPRVVLAALLGAALSLGGMVSHDLNMAAMYADRLLLLSKGRVARQGTTGQVIDFALLEEVYGCTLLVDKSPLGRYPRVHLVPKRYLDR